MFIYSSQIHCAYNLRKLLVVSNNQKALPIGNQFWKINVSWIVQQTKSRSAVYKLVYLLFPADVK